MGNIYIQTDGNRRVTKIHYNPFDPVQGTGETREEMEKTGFFVDEIPEPKNITGRRAIAMYNPDTNGIYYEYVGIPLSERERLDLIEGTLNELLINQRSTNSNPVAVMSLESNNEVDEKDMEALSNTAAYIAHQIISGNMEISFAYETFPNIAGMIRDVLQDNGIQG